MFEELDTNYLKTKKSQQIHKTLFSKHKEQLLADNIYNDPGIQDEMYFNINSYARLCAQRKISHPLNNPLYWIVNNCCYYAFRKCVNEVLIKEENKKKTKEAIHILNTENVLITMPLTYEACKKYGKNTSWCITSKDSVAYWNYYCGDGYYPIYFLPKKSQNNKFIIYTKPKQYHITDQEDNNITASVLIRELVSSKDYNLSVAHLLFLVFCVLFAVKMSSGIKSQLVLGIIFKYIKLPTTCLKTFKTFLLAVCAVTLSFNEFFFVFSSFCQHFTELFSFSIAQE